MRKKPVNKESRGKLSGLLLVMALSLGLTAGAAFAYLSDTDHAKNTFTYGDVRIDIKEPSFPGNGSPALERQVFYTETAKDPMITNKGSCPAIVFMEVTSPAEEVIYIGDNGQRSEAVLGDIFWFKQKSDPTAFHDNHFDEGWMALPAMEKLPSDNAKTRTYVFAYRTVLDPKETTTPLFDKVQLRKFSARSIRSDSKENIEVVGYAIQAGSLMDKSGTYIDTDAALSEETLTYIYQTFLNENGYVKEVPVS